MIKLIESVIIAAPPEKVFDVVDDTASLPEVWRNLSNIRNLKRLPNGGHSLDFDYTMAGIHIKSSSVDLEHVRPHRIVTRTTGALISTLTWDFQPIPGGVETNLVLEIKYEVPVPVVGKLAEVILAKVNETDIVYVINYPSSNWKEWSANQISESDRWAQHLPPVGEPALSLSKGIEGGKGGLYRCSR